MNYIDTFPERLKAEAMRESYSRPTEDPVLREAAKLWLRYKDEPFTSQDSDHFSNGRLEFACYAPAKRVT